MIDLYAAGTSNGMRARIALEECGLKYNWHPIDLTKGEHKTPQYLAMNPMGQIPVIVDNEGPGGKKITLSQSSAIMVYCAEKAGKFIPKDPAKKAAMLEAYMSASTDITPGDRKSTRLNSSHSQISYAVFCLKKKKQNDTHIKTPTIDIHPNVHATQTSIT